VPRTTPSLLRYGPPLIDCYDQIQSADWHDTWPDDAEAEDAKKNAYKMCARTARGALGYS
jgi:hypothetical protein